APSWVSATGLAAGSVPFSGITSGTNTQAAMVVGSGSSLTYTGGTATSGVMNANQLLGGTWAIPGAIGATTANSGAFTTLSATGTTTLNGIAYTWPNSAGANGYVLQTNGLGMLTWVAASGVGTNYWAL